MTKLLLFSVMSLISLSFMSCKNAADACQAQTSSSTSNCSTKTPPTTTPEVPGTPPDTTGVPSEAFLFQTNSQLTNFAIADEVKVEKALEIIKKVIVTSEFRNRVLSFTYGGKPGFVDSTKSPAQIYQSLLDGAEDLLPEVDHEMDLDLELYYASTSTVGYTYPDVVKIWMNTKFFNVYTPAEVAGNIFHEWTHKLGYVHAQSYSVSRDSSVPYALGYLMEELGAKVQ
jgi:hypothetical protein